MATYPRDEFDDAALHRDIVGAHRAKPSLLRRLAPLLIVLVVAPSLAWVAFTFGLRDQVPQAADALKSLGEDGTSKEAPGGPEKTGSGGATEDDGPGSGVGAAEDEESDGLASREDASERGGSDPTAIDRTTSVTVLDGSQDDVGEDVARTLRSSGYGKVTQSTYSSGSPVDTTVYVRSEEYLDTASDVARLVSAQIGTPTRPARVEVVESAEAASSAPIVVVVR